MRLVEFIENLNEMELEELAKIDTVVGINAFAESRGVTLDQEEVQEYVALNSELDEEELDGVAGGLKLLYNGPATNRVFRFTCPDTGEIKERVNFLRK